MAMEEMPDERPLDPTKLMRIAGTVREVLEEARRMQPTKEAAAELAALYGRVKKQLEDALPEFLVTELDSMELDLPFRDGATAEEVRVAYSALIGWMGGLFQGLQASFQALEQPTHPADQRRVRHAHLLGGRAVTERQVELHRVQLGDQELRQGVLELLFHPAVESGKLLGGLPGRLHAARLVQDLPDHAGDAHQLGGVQRALVGDFLHSHASPPSAGVVARLPSRS
ncbi:MAG TPA: proteasome activator [Actinomycetota bacterium]|nr:proteasome activator [Actinomycetota bacterium]